MATLDQHLRRPPRARTPEERRKEFRRSTGRPIRRLSSSGTIEREAELEALRTFARRPISPSDLDENSYRNGTVLSQHGTRDTEETTTLSKSPKTRRLSRTTALEQYEVFRAIDKKDLDLLGEFRDKAFHLLLERQAGGQTPMVYAMQHGPSYQEVVLFLVGAVSQWINRLNDTDFSKPETAKLLKLSRANLKVAIDEGLAKLQTGLIASFLQTLVMCEGDGWIRDQLTPISFALRAGAAGKAVEVAGSTVRRFCTTSLKNADLIADVEDYMANATSDLLMMSAWSMAVADTQVSLIPLYYFARDDRVYNAFVERLDEHQDAIRAIPNRRLRRQLEALRTELQGRALSSRAKIERLRNVLEGQGM